MERRHATAAASVVWRAMRCAAQVVGLLIRGQLHLSRDNLGKAARLPDGREFVVFRESSCGEVELGQTVTLAVWFHLRGVPAGARVRRYVFERESILNTSLYAGFDGYLVKLWMVDPASCDYAGLYSWRDRHSADRYARYITAVLRPLSVPGSVGYVVIDQPLDGYLRADPSIPPVEVRYGGSVTANTELEDHHG